MSTGLASGAHVLIAVFLAGLAACTPGPPPQNIVLATTTSVGNSGLLDLLVAGWQRETGIEIRPTLAGSGRALRMLEQGQADVVISHAPSMEAAMQQKHPDWRIRRFMYNEFVLVGARGDPAGVRGASTLDDACRRIVRAGTTFVSRGDQSGTHEREQELWRSAGATPAPTALLTSGAGMAITLRQASEREAYTLTDRATFEQLKKSVRLEIVWQGGARLLNSYAVIVDGSASQDARRFSDWLVEGTGQDVIRAFRIPGSDIQPFTPGNPEWVPNR